MRPKRLRVGIRAQLTFIVLVAALLSTIATLYIANSAIQSYVIDQAKLREGQNLAVAQLILQTEFGDNISIDVKGRLVVDSPRASNATSLGGGVTAQDFAPFPLNDDVDYVDEVQHFVGGVVAVFQCANERGALLPGGCPRISANIPKLDANGQEETGTRNLTDKLSDSILHYIQTHSSDFVGQDTVSGIQYMTAYRALYSPQHDFIGALFVGEPMAGIQKLIVGTTIQLAIVGALIMIVGAIFAILLAQAITSTLQNAVRQVTGASTKFGTIASQQANGSAQQVWAINAVSQGLRGLSETASDIARRSEQLAQMGAQVLQRRAEVSPAQIDSIINYVTRSSYDISVVSRQQASTYERMTGAMQAVLEVAQQVVRDSQQTSDGAEKLDQVVQQLQRLLGTNEQKAEGAANKMSMMVTTAEPKEETAAPASTAAAAPPVALAPTVRSVRPSPDRLRAPLGGDGWPNMPTPIHNPTSGWPNMPGPVGGPSAKGWPTTSSPMSGGMLPPQSPNRSMPASGMIPGRTGPEEPPTRSGFPRSPEGRGFSGDPGTFPPFDQWNSSLDNTSGPIPPTYLPPRRDPGRR